MIEMNCRSIRDDLKRKGQKAKKPWLEDEDLKVRLQGFPKEVSDALNEGKDWVQ